MIPFKYSQPESLKEIIDVLHDQGDKAALLAGGTALLIDINRGELSPDTIVSLWGVPNLKNINEDNGLEIGTLVTITNIARYIRSDQYLGCLKDAALVLGAQQVQNIATIGGNLCKASPGADMVPPLLCLDAILTLIGPEGERTAPVDGFLTGPDKTALRHAEVLTTIHIPKPPDRTGTAFIKIMRRHAVDCSIVGAAARITLEEDGVTCKDARLGLNAVAPNPFRPKTAENILIGKKLTLEIIKEAAWQARELSQPITDVRATAEYRRMLVETLVERSILQAYDRAKDGDKKS
jgi:CO/xanthine dehydrogenase FAD-binding subunit